MLRAFSTIWRQDWATAPPENTMLRDANVPNPWGEVPVSPWRTEIMDGSRESSWAAICAKVVSSPWPWLCMPTNR